MLFLDISKLIILKNSVKLLLIHRISGDGTVDYQEFCNLMREMVEKAVEMEKKIREAFGSIDSNGDGQISRSEIIKAMAVQGRELTAEEADEIIGTVDKDGNKTISYDGRGRVGFVEHKYNYVLH